MDHYIYFCVGALLGLCVEVIRDKLDAAIDKEKTEIEKRLRHFEYMFVYGVANSIITPIVSGIIFTN